jgi:hypothetical protein
MMKTSARTAVVRAEIRTERLSNTGLEPYHYINLHGELISFPALLINCPGIMYSFS